MRASGATTEATGTPTEVTIGATHDADGFGALFAAEQQRLFRYAYVVSGDSDVAQELVSEAFARMYPKWRRGRVADPAGYLRRTIVNLERGRFRKLQRQRSVEGRIPVPRTEQRDERVLDAELLARGLATLGPRQRAAVVLRYLEDRSEADTAAILSVSVGTVKSQVSRALAHLRTVLGNEIDGAEQ